MVQSDDVRTNSKIVIELQTKNTEHKQKDDADELMFATNWTRAFKINNQ